MTALGGLMLMAYPLFVWTDHDTFSSALRAQLVFAVLMSGAIGPIAAVMVEMFPTRTRFSGIAVGYNLTLAVIGGTAPLVSTWIIVHTGNLAAPAYYLILLVLVSMGASLGIHSRVGEQLA